jgi:hypothetical protein
VRIMSLDLVAEGLRKLAWLSPVSFLLFLMSMLVVGILPWENFHSIFAIVEWSEMLAGSLISIVLAAATIWNTKGVADAGLCRTRLIGIGGLALWVCFWVFGVALHRGSG